MAAEAPSQADISFARAACDDLWQSLLHLNNALTRLEKRPFHQRTHELLSVQFNSLSEKYTRLKLWIENHDRQQELPEVK